MQSLTHAGEVLWMERGSPQLSTQHTEGPHRKHWNIASMYESYGTNQQHQGRCHECYSSWVSAPSIQATGHKRMPFYVPRSPRNLISDPLLKEGCCCLLAGCLGAKRRSVWYPARDKVSLWKKRGTQQSNAQQHRSKTQCYCSISRNLSLPLLPFIYMWLLVKDLFAGGWVHLG